MNPTAGSIRFIATIDTSQYMRGASDVEKANSDIEKSSNSTEKKSNAAFNGIAKIGLAAVAAAAVAVGAAITSNIGNAIRRVDTLNNASRTFENIGFASDVVDKSMKALVASIQGLPTPLDSAVRGMTALASTYGDISKGQKVFTALNNAILGFGGTADMVNNAILQLSQLPMDGPLDAQTWNSLRNSGLTPVLVAMAKDMGKSVNEMKEAFGEGELTVQDFTDALIKMNTDGGGGMKSLELIAKDATGGIGTGFANMQTAITRGLAEVIKAIGSEDISAFISNIGASFEKALKQTAGFVKFVIRNKDIFVPIIIALTTAISLLTSWYVAVKAVTAAQKVWNLVSKANTLGLIVIAVASLVAAFMYLWNNVEGFRNFFMSVWSGMKTAVSEFGSFVSNIWSTITTSLSEAWNTVKTNVTDVIDSIQETFEKVSDKVEKILYDWRYWIQNIGIVIGTILLPQIAKVGAAWAVSAAQAVASFVVMAVQAVANAAIVAGAWVASAVRTAFVWVTQTLPQIIAGFVTMAAQAVINAARITAAFIASSVRTLVGWAITFAGYLAGLAIMVAQTLIAGARMAIGFALALGPIGLIVAAVIGAAALIIANWDTVKRFVIGVWESIRSAASSVWNWINGVFSTIGDIATSVIKGAVNGVLGFAERTINGFIRIINSTLKAINKLPGVNIGSIGEVSIPKLAEGGIVTSPTLAMVGEGRESEAVIPLSKLDQMLDNSGSSSNVGSITINMDGIMARSRSDLRDIAKDLIRAVDEERSARGLQPINGSIG